MYKVLIIMAVFLLSSIFVSIFDHTYADDEGFEFNFEPSPSPVIDISVIGKPLDSELESFLFNKQWCWSDQKLIIKNKIKGNVYNIYYKDSNALTPDVDKAIVTMLSTKEIVLFYFYKNPISGTKSFERFWFLVENDNSLKNVKWQRGDEYSDGTYRGYDDAFNSVYKLCDIN